MGVRKIRYAVLGLGHIAQVAVLPAFQNAKNSELAGLVSGSPQKLTKIARNYGVARIMNLSYGEFLVAASFASYWLFTGWALNPLLGLAIVVPIGFGVSMILYRVLLTPLVRRAPTRDAAASGR